MPGAEGIVPGGQIKGDVAKAAEVELDGGEDGDNS